MNETIHPPAVEPVERSRELAAALDLTDGALGGVLFSLIDRLEAAVGIKQMPSGRYVHVNARMAELYGMSPEQLLGRTDIELLGAERAASLRKADQTAIAQSAPHVISHRIDRGRNRRDFEVTRFALQSINGVSRHLCNIWIETTQVREREERLAQALDQLEQQHAAGESMRRELQERTPRDAATGLYQVAQFDDQLRREVDLSSREHREFALVSIAIDPPPDVSAAQQAAIQVRVLEALGRLLRSNTRAMDASCRLDEDRFAILLSGVGLATAHSRMEGLRRQCATQVVVLEGRDLSFTVSMGVASFPHTAHTQEELMAAADLALAEARRRGGNHVALASIRFDRA